MIKSIIPDEQYEIDDDVVTVDSAKVIIEINLYGDRLTQIYANNFYLPQDWAGDIFVDDVYSAVYDVISDIFGDSLDSDHLHAIVIDRDGENDSGTKFCTERTSYFTFGGFKTRVEITFCYPKSK